MYFLIFICIIIFRVLLSMPMHDNHRCMQSLEIYFLRYNKVYVIEFHRWMHDCKINAFIVLK
jgi:hypothetical protein